MTAARWALPGAAGMTARSSSLQRTVRRCGHREKGFARGGKTWARNSSAATTDIEEDYGSTDAGKDDVPE